MFKLSVVTDEVSQELETACIFARDFMLEGVEIRNVWNRPPQDLMNQVDEIKALLGKYGLKTIAIASPFFKANLDNDVKYREHIDILKKCIKLAHELDCNIIRGFSFWRKGKLDERIDDILEKFQEPLEIIEKEDVILGIENEPSTFVTNGEELGKFLRELNSKNVRCLWDPGNDVWDPYGETAYPDGYEHVRGNIVHVHVKDGVRTESGKHMFVAFGEGDIRYHDQLKALREDKYSGYLSLETHWRLESPQDMAKGDSLDINTKAFSDLGEKSSRICMQNILNLINKMEEELN
jgi:sugar phosphate isomerase/epimerase